MSVQTKTKTFRLTPMFSDSARIIRIRDFDDVSITPVIRNAVEKEAGNLLIHLGFNDQTGGSFMAVGMQKTDIKDIDLLDYKLREAFINEIETFLVGSDDDVFDVDKQWRALCSKTLETGDHLNS